ncbi:MAG: Crp/Fnr family transcriptional regulator [Betaproteobacteria bacterium]|nr:Crp/Fnr family transcriptional regulator [Betaproteobacteria bacterium]
MAVERAAATLGHARGRRLPAPVGSVERSLSLAVRLRAGQALYVAGQTGDAVFVLHRGLVKETLEADEGERVVRLIGVAGVTGLSALLGEPHRHSAQVVGDGEACRVPVTRLRDRIRFDPQGAFALLAHWQGALDDTDHIIAAFATGPARSRLARYILFLLDTLGDQARLRRQEAAELIGVTPVSVTRLIGEFKREGLVRENGLQLVDCDRLRLARLAGGVEGAGAAAAARDAPAGWSNDQLAAAVRES